jgi:hypothetical protein
VQRTTQRLERYAKNKLALARRTFYAGDVTERWTADVGHRIIIQVAVQGVKEFAAKLHLHALADVEGLLDTQVLIGIAEAI